MRRQQLVDLIKAYDLPNIPIDGTKEEMLIGLVAAEQTGVFQQQPKSAAHFACAMRSSDDPPIVNEDGSPSPIQARVDPEVGEVEDFQEPDSIEVLRDKAAGYGIGGIEHLSRVDLVRAIAEVEIARLEGVH